MATYKKVDADALNASLGTVADAIRERGGTTSALSFPAGMAAAVLAIPESGGTIGQRIAITPGITATQYVFSVPDVDKLTAFVILVAMDGDLNGVSAIFHQLRGSGVPEPVDYLLAEFSAESAPGRRGSTQLYQSPQSVFATADTNAGTVTISRDGGGVQLLRGKTVYLFPIYLNGGVTNA